MKQTAQQTPPPIKQDQQNSSFSLPLAQKSSWLSRQKPGILMTLAALFFTPSVIGMVGDLISNRISTSPGIIEETTWGWLESGSGNLSIEQVGSTVLIQDEAITTFHIQKANPAYRSYVELEVETTNLTNDDEVNDWPMVGAMGFECSEIWVSSVAHFYYDPPQSVEDIHVETDLTEEYSDYIGNYFYDENNEQSYETLLNRYKEEFPSDYATIQIDSTGMETQSGIVTYTVTNPEGVQDYDTLYGSVNIVFKKDGQVVFGAVDHYSTSSNVRSKSFAYSPDVQIPSYDDVEIINMHS